MLNALATDFRIIFERDPAARNWLEVLFCYPGLQALLMHRFAHKLYQLKLPFIPRLLSHIARFLTGIEIHPGAKIGHGVFIDHGMGVVIGETAIVGDYALIYQGVTLGGTGKESGKRHPTLGENVVVGAGAKVLGNITLGDNVRIGAGSVVLRDVPSNCTVVGVPGRIVYRSGERVDPLAHGSLPDSEAQVIRALVDRIESLEQQLQQMQNAFGQTHLPLLEPTHQSSIDSLEPALSLPLVQLGEGSMGAAMRSTPAVADVPLTLHQTPLSPSSNPSASPDPTPASADPQTHNSSTRTSCRLQDKIIQEFLDGSGI